MPLTVEDCRRRPPSNVEMLREMKHTSDTLERVLSLLIVPRFEPRWARDGEERTFDTYDRFIEDR